MTLTVTDIVAGPFTVTGGVDVLSYDFLVYTASEIEVVAILDGLETVVDPGLYTVQINTNLLGQPIEGGTVTYDGPVGQVVELRANPSFEQNQVFTLLGFRPPTLNELADRAALRDLRLQYLQSHFPGPKGDPGGNVLAAGLFGDLHEMDLPEGTNLIQTTGHTTLGVGGASYAVTLIRTGETPYRTQMATGEWVELVVDGPMSIQQFGYVFGQDVLAVHDVAVAALTEIAGGGTLDYRETGAGGYFTTSDLVVQVSNIHIRVYDDVRTTKTSPSSAFRFEGPASNIPIRNVSLTCPGRRCKIDGNGRNVVGYTYGVGYSYPAVYFIYCDKPYAQNIWAYNGLVNSLIFDFCGSPEHVDCDGTDAEYDNGISINFTPSWLTFSADDPSTWTNAKMVRPRAWGNKGIGITNYAAIGMLIDHPVFWDNGNDILAHPNNGGGLSVEADYTTDAKALRDSHTTIIAPRGTSNYQIGIFTSAVGVKIVAPDVSKTILPVNKPNPNLFYGCNYFVVGASAVQIDGGSNEKSGSYGLLALAAGSPTIFFPSVDIVGGSVKRSHFYGISGRGFARLTVSDVLIDESGYGLSSNQIGLSLDNTGASFNAGGGYAYIDAQINRSAGLAVQGQQVGEIQAPSLRTRGNRVGVAAGSITRFDNCSLVDVGKVVSYDDAATTGKTQFAVEFVSTCAVASIDEVHGDASISLVTNNAPGRPKTWGDRARPDFQMNEFRGLGVNGGSAFAGFNTRTFTTVQVNQPGWTANAAAGTVALPAGSYRVRGRFPAYKVGHHVIFIWNDTDNASIQPGTDMLASATVDMMSDSILDQEFTLAVAKTIKFVHYVDAARASDGFGVAGANQAGAFAQVSIWRL